MTVETKFLRLPQPVPLGARIDGWRVCWLGGWDRDRFFFIVRGPDRQPPSEAMQQALSGLSGPWGRPQAGWGSAPAPSGEPLLRKVEKEKCPLDILPAGRVSRRR
jgi:hypothetical protein